MMILLLLRGRDSSYYCVLSIFFFYIIQLNGQITVAHRAEAFIV